LLGDDGLQLAQGVFAERRGARPGEVDVQQHLFVACQFLLITRQMQAVVEVQAFCCRGR